MKAVWLILIALLPPTAVAADAPPQATQVEATRKVLAAIVTAARKNAGKPPEEQATGDALTTLYIRAAAAAAQKLPAEQAPGAFLLALGLGLDDSNILRKNPLSLRLCRQVETDAGRAARLRVLGKPTMRGRRDWTQHFVVSCFLTEFVGAELAEAAGILKEHLDSQPGGSGFSFGDLNADLAGVELARRLRKSNLALEALAKGFTVKDYLPDARGLREDLSAEQFARDYGSATDERFKAEVAGIRKRIAALPSYQK
jgi:hypothetical protein